MKRRAASCLIVMTPWLTWGMICIKHPVAFKASAFPLLLLVLGDGLHSPVFIAGQFTQAITAASAIALGILSIRSSSIGKAVLSTILSLFALFFVPVLVASAILNDRL